MNESPANLKYVLTGLVTIITSCLVCSTSCDSQVKSDVPRVSIGKQFENGIAAKYPGDQGIGKDSRIVFFEDFEGPNLAAVTRDWESVKFAEIMSLSDDTPAGMGGKSLLVKHVGGQGTGTHLYRRLKTSHDKLFYRFYVKFDRECAPIHHFFHVGGYHPATAWPQGGAGERPQGNERFSTGVEPFGKQWRWDYYSYWMEMRGSPPRGQTWGNSFVNNSKVKVTKGNWQCVELMMKLNEVGKSNGEMALWIDGRQVSHLGPGFPSGKWVFDKFLPGQGGKGVRWNDEKKDRETLKFPGKGKPFGGFRWRDNDKLQLNFIWLLCYITKSPSKHVSKIWFDQIVVATEYIGPIVGKKVNFARATSPLQTKMIRPSTEFVPLMSN